MTNTTPQHPPATLKHDPADVELVIDAMKGQVVLGWREQALAVLDDLDIPSRIEAARREERERWLTENTIEMPDWVESAVMTRANYEDPWAVSLTGDSHGVGKSSLVAALAPTLREAFNKAVDQHEGWQSFVLVPAQEAPDER